MQTEQPSARRETGGLQRATVVMRGLLAPKLLFPKGLDFASVFVKRRPPAVGLPCYELISKSPS